MTAVTLNRSLLKEERVGHPEGRQPIVSCIQLVTLSVAGSLLFLEV